MPTKDLEDRYVPFQCMILAYSNRFSVEGVSTAQYYILDTLNKQGPKTTKELAEMKGITQSGISKLTKRLLEKKYINQERQTNDRRSYNIVLTSEGKAFLSRVDDFGNEIMNLIEEALTADEVQSFSMMCKKITSLYAEKL
ncbi:MULTISPECIES: MarR family winged helix-turn-helix transcriptional regulator [Paenibacillus]|jgi:DNA-binding MarR family transcriptional regulator|uniref:MarR family transcriptional regulator n=2 Tax=Paenibacillus TaxID=44249 RepID=E3EHU2_PAEPS|nr:MULTISPECIES: MarR family transcriptional regulator [Paenibacillus]ADO56354.1 MarR family transcriptional regulator [Paenibacillus polymyxa SC2]AJE49749.1 MarR family transcriptional regulator [Paenibacillus polymyxa]AUO08997.1 MarR family transcriptional regulator [Paenibacillus sp. lzh-N1]AZH29322.1 MarR family transcriptional regulator [Paenibacillus sp. M-152]KAE8557691.1 MarR family transcriptional regulator [Paenibacillus polymyxa]